jgi:hypothetical protein
LKKITLVFGRADFLKDCPFDPNYEFLFSGEELLLSACLFTNGWNIYNPSVSVIYHYYARDKKKTGKAFIDENKRTNSQKRMRYYFKWNITVPENDLALYEIEKYPLGSYRSLDSYWNYSGLDVQFISDKRWCNFDKVIQNLSFIHQQAEKEYPLNLNPLPLIN